MRPSRLLPWLALALAGCAHEPDRSLESWLKRGRSDAYAPLGADSARALGGAFDASLSGTPAHRQAWHALDYEQRTESAQHAVRERPPARRGWGGYVFRSAPARALVIQAPHSDTDRGTGAIALALYRARSAWAVALNSTPRTLSGADLAHVPNGPFVLLADAALGIDPSSLVLQVHGFGPRTARRHGLSDLSVVVSNGTTVPDPALRDLAACLTSAGFDARLFGEQAAFPGGTGNAVGRHMRERGLGQFVHLELGAALREQLLKHPDRLQEFSVCV